MTKPQKKTNQDTEASTETVTGPGHPSGSDRSAIENYGPGLMTTEQTTRRWEHRKGDRYVHVIASAWMNERAYGIAHCLSSRGEFVSASEAWTDGLRHLNRSDDFNTGVIRNGKLVAILWRKDIVDDEPEVVAEIANELGLAA